MRRRVYAQAVVRLGHVLLFELLVLCIDDISSRAEPGNPARS